MESRSATRGIFDIASDNLGLTYIAHCGSIQVLSKTGEHLRSFSVAGDNIVSAIITHVEYQLPADMFMSQMKQHIIFYRRRVCDLVWAVGEE